MAEYKGDVAWITKDFFLAYNTIYMDRTTLLTDIMVMAVLAAINLLLLVLTANLWVFIAFVIGMTGFINNVVFYSKMYDPEIGFMQIMKDIENGR